MSGDLRNQFKNYDFVLNFPFLLFYFENALRTVLRRCHVYKQFAARGWRAISPSWSKRLKNVQPMLVCVCEMNAIPILLAIHHENGIDNMIWYTATDLDMLNNSIILPFGHLSLC